MMQGRFLVNSIVKSSSRVVSRGMAAEAAAAASTQLTLNFVTPHTPIYTKKVVGMVLIPGVGGEFGVTAGHSPIVSELKPGVVSVIHVGVSNLIHIHIHLFSDAFPSVLSIS